MKALEWLAALMARWRATGLPGRHTTAPRGGPKEIDIDLSGFGHETGTSDATDYDVHSLGEPIDPARVRGSGRRAGS